MRLFEKTFVFDSDWETVTSAFWTKYPNELQPHVLRVDTLDVDIDPEKQEFATRRLHSLKYCVPRWMECFFGGSSPVGFGLEEAYCSLPDKTLHLKSRNYTFASFFRVDEECTYTPHPTDPSRTLYKQTATYKVFGLGAAINRALERAAVRSAEEKSSVGFSVVQSRASSLEEQGWWRRQCAACIHSLEAAAVNATQHYRDLVRHVEESLHISLCAPSTPPLSSTLSLDRFGSSPLLEPSLFAACAMSASAKRFLLCRPSPPFSLPRNDSSSSLFSSSLSALRSPLASPAMPPSLKALLPASPLSPSSSPDPNVPPSPSPSSPSLSSSAPSSTAVDSTAESGEPRGGARSGDTDCACLRPAPGGTAPLSTSEWRRRQQEERAREAHRKGITQTFALSGEAARPAFPASEESMGAADPGSSREAGGVGRASEEGNAANRVTGRTFGERSYAWSRDAHTPALRPETGASKATHV
ncbi:putative MSF1-like conserved region domain-containing protein [Neospora caninum Liverpool]|uniref:Putative MSF1-like conserved region domain-containing protein n=1 Tax=Neospora caninum (strain Liverpool) TaxID=572307 RepID=F0V9F7_NEOCL|nr:putative MSF1-like conserved region domain-containing protein [Neospora caninum Liverpool]CBZ50382.1 putative MSF1-like conserved region domain-containing protein [Neospora caninum Liverpool]|eukprot:XP_003880416.1 putative MSF1-like conserved region domain-containing protein [Neospora caninum Liverpool]